MLIPTRPPDSTTTSADRADPSVATAPTEPATTRVVVVTERREVSLTPADTSLTVPRGGEATTNLTLSGVETSVRAVRIEAVRTGGPPVGFGLEFTEALETWGSAGGSVVSLDRSSADRESLAVDRSPNGTFAVARLSVRSGPGFVGADATSLGNDTLTVKLAWIVDSEGIPYSLDEPVTVRYEVTKSNTTDEG